ncbi:DSS1/SEM1 family-domain-containing protein [Aspergillus tamarii]|uniref:26S proteasome complex subunit SEM1 n=1 Tax=Aspergillus tamarii TaxID=41984 RepID=A0A5N6UNB4_ASPTM|nr:DSS1/SEM1 family-domain-containing protein [Aspergillus tamarii]
MSNSTQSHDKPEASQQPQQQKPPVLEEDDEFEDFPIEDWPQEETEQASGSANGANNHLWEESWDDDDAAEDFSKQLKCVLVPYGSHGGPSCSSC